MSRSYRLLSRVRGRGPWSGGRGWGFGVVGPGRVAGRADMMAGRPGLVVYGDVGQRGRWVQVRASRRLRHRFGLMG